MRDKPLCEFAVGGGFADRGRGIRQVIYTNSLPDDPLFPFYYVLSPREQLHPRGGVEERATQVFNEISYTSARREADIAGAGVYAWGISAHILKPTGWATRWAHPRHGIGVLLILTKLRSDSTGCFMVQGLPAWDASIN
ncbi:MAG TPA: hypothetical protein VMT32_03925 [Bryobacteraceae bacterium]|nr:hypothetical protein [Bryobacteraceae bacterium]